MVYFIFWCVLLAVVLLSLPIAHFMEKAALRREMGPDVEAAGGAEPAEGDEMLNEDEAGEAPAEDFEEFGAATPVGEDDFSAFDDFK